MEPRSYDSKTSPNHQPSTPMLDMGYMLYLVFHRAWDWMLLTKHLHFVQRSSHLVASL